MATFEDSLRRLRQNWDKGLTDNLRRVWMSEFQAGGWTEQDVEEAVTRCIRDKARVYCPAGFAELSVYLRRDENSAAQLGWWGAEGDWGGDWSGASNSAVMVALQAMARNCLPGKRYKVDAFASQVALPRGIVLQDAASGG